VITNTSAAELPATEEAAATTEAPDSAGSAEVVPTTTLPILQATNTRAIVTPGPPPGPVDFSTPTPFGGLFATPTPLDLLVTPTDIFNGSSQCAYVIQPGDTLYQIALNNDTTVDALRQANPQLSGDLIQPGDEINLPGCGEPSATSAPAPTQPAFNGTSIGQRTHIVRSGDTLFAIAREYGVTVQAIIDANNLANPDRLDLGQELVIP
jgi:LysM repeat protein